MNSERYNVTMSEIEPIDIIENEIIHQLYPASVGYNQIIEKLKIIKKVRIRCIIENNFFNLI